MACLDDVANKASDFILHQVERFFSDDIASDSFFYLCGDGDQESRILARVLFANTVLVSSPFLLQQFSHLPLGKVLIPHMPSMFHDIWDRPPSLTHVASKRSLQKTASRIVPGKGIDVSMTHRTLHSHWQWHRMDYSFYFFYLNKIFLKDRLGYCVRLHLCTQPVFPFRAQSSFSLVRSTIVRLLLSARASKCSISFGPVWPKTARLLSVYAIAQFLSAWWGLVVVVSLLPESMAACRCCCGLDYLVHSSVDCHERCPHQISF